MANSTSPRAKDRPWYGYLTIDLLMTVADKTILHPFVAWIIPMSLRAQAYPPSHIAFRVSFAYAALLSVFFFLSIINYRLGYGNPREVDLSDEVIVITGGAGGLGRLIADFYAMRGVSVAVLDIEQGDVEGKLNGAFYYQCDIADVQQLERTFEKIRHEVSILKACSVYARSLDLLTVAPRLEHRRF